MDCLWLQGALTGPCTKDNQTSLRGFVLASSLASDPRPYMRPNRDTLSCTCILWTFGPGYRHQHRCNQIWTAYFVGELSFKRVVVLLTFFITEVRINLELVPLSLSHEIAQPPNGVWLRPRSQPSSPSVNLAGQPTSLRCLIFGKPKVNDTDHAVHSSWLILRSSVGRKLRI